MDKDGLLNREGLWNRRGLLLAAAFAASAFIGWNYFDMEQALAALAIFALVFVPLLAIVFALALAERSAERIFSQTATRPFVPNFWHSLVDWLTVPPPARQLRLQPLPFAPRLVREFQRFHRVAFHLPGRRAA